MLGRLWLIQAIEVCIDYVKIILKSSALENIYQDVILYKYTKNNIESVAFERNNMQKW